MQLAAWAVMPLIVISLDSRDDQGLLSRTVWAEVLRNVGLSGTVVLCRPRYALFAWTSESR